MISPEISCVGIANQSRVTHQIPNTPMQVCSRVIDVFSILDADQVRDLRGKEKAAIPARYTAAKEKRAQVSKVIGGSERFQTCVLFIVNPGDAEGWYSLSPQRIARRHFERHVAAEDAACVVDRRNEWIPPPRVPDRARERGSAWDARAVFEELQMADAAVSQRKRDAAVRRHPSEKIKRAVRKRLRARFPKCLGASR